MALNRCTISELIYFVSQKINNAIVAGQRQTYMPVITMKEKYHLDVRQVNDDIKNSVH